MCCQLISILVLLQFPTNITCVENMIQTNNNNLPPNNETQSGEGLNRTSILKPRNQISNRNARGRIAIYCVIKQVQIHL